MSYKIINNLSNDNHSVRLRELFSSSEEVTIVSPFLMGDFTDFLSEIVPLQIRKISLLTTLCPKSFDQINKINALISLVEFPAVKDGLVKCEISLNNKLHGKIYIFDKVGDESIAIISSANFTASGLSLNHEWGIEISDKSSIDKLKLEINSSIEYHNVKFSDLYEMQQATVNFLQEEPQTEKRDISLALTDFIKIDPTMTWDSNIQYWLKPIGVSHEPVLPTREFSSLEDELHFSKQRPNGVRPNDILIAYGVGLAQILAIYQVTSYPIHVTQEEIDNSGEEWLVRWPWYVTAKNLTPKFGANWSTHAFNKNSLRIEYLSIYPGSAITAVGGQSLGGLNFGKDKLRLAPDFAKFIINKILKVEADS